jgi:hypothetical protein
MMNELVEKQLDEKILPDWLVNPRPTKPEDVDVANIARMDTAITKVNTYFKKKYWPPKMVETPLKGNRSVTAASGPPVEFFWTPSRHRSHENLGYAIVWGYDVRNLHYWADCPSPAYSVYHGPISLFLNKFSKDAEELNKWERFILEEVTTPEFVHERNSE